MMAMKKKISPKQFQEINDVEADSGDVVGIVEEEDEVMESMRVSRTLSEASEGERMFSIRHYSFSFFFSFFFAAAVAYIAFPLSFLKLTKYVETQNTKQK